MIVGARVAGCAAAIPLVRAGRKVVLLDRSRFPSNVLSTHGIWPSAVAELRKLGALERVLAYEPPKIRSAVFHHLGVPLKGGFNPVENIDYMLVIGRPQLDLALVETACAEGADVRERTAVTGLVWDGDRAAGVRYRSLDGDGAEGEVRAPLVIGADGRRSMVAEHVGAARPYRGSRNGRGFAWWYMDDPKVGTDWRETGALLRVNETIVLIGGMPADRMLVLAVCPAADIPRYRRDPEGMFERLMRENRRMADRVRGAGRATHAFTADELSAYFRASSGHGWALTGDAGHFKDPGIAQGIRDALFFSRLLGEVAAPVLGSPAKLDWALHEWEAERDRACLSTYHWANRETRVDPVQPILLEALRTFSAGEGEFGFGDVLSRLRDYEEVANRRRGMLWVSRALLRPGADRRLIARQALQEMRIDSAVRLERWLGRFRTTRPNPSELPGPSWPAAHARTAREAPSQAAGSGNGSARAPVLARSGS